MFDIGWTEMLVVACVAIIVVGPKDLPKMLRTFGKAMGNIRRMAADFQRQFNDAIRETELDEVRQSVTQSETFQPLTDAKKSMEDFQKTMQESIETNKAKADVTKSARTEPAKTTGSTSKTGDAAQPKTTKKAATTKKATVSKTKPDATTKSSPGRKTATKPAAKARTTAKRRSAVAKSTAASSRTRTNKTSRTKKQGEA